MGQAGTNETYIFAFRMTSLHNRADYLWILINITDETMQEDKKTD